MTAEEVAHPRLCGRCFRVLLKGQRNEPHASHQLRRHC